MEYFIFKKYLRVEMIKNGTTLIYPQLTIIN